jgi:putative nucleotidyltransferase with HDIG domain
MSHIFISYARKDIDFAQKIVTALAANELDTWIDWKSIPKGENWLEEIYLGIEGADAFVFLISPDSVVSENCSKEIAHAVKNGKRILPIVIHDTDPKLIHAEISKRNWIFCRDGQDDFSKAIEQTRETIHTDYEWLKYHTRLHVRALESDHRKDTSRLLRGTELQEAEQLLATADSQKDPQPTSFQRLYVLASRTDEDEQLLRSNQELLLAYDATIVGLISALDLRDKETEGHTKRVTDITLRLAREMDIRDEQLIQIRRGSLLHDIGKIGVSDTILHKPGKLTEDEWQIMRRHPEIGARIVEGIPFLQEALPIIRYHHERWDGSGYPHGLTGKDIPIQARIFAVADAYDALTSTRLYRKKSSGEEALQYLREQAGVLFDPQVIEIFAKLLQEEQLEGQGTG